MSDQTTGDVQAAIQAGLDSAPIAGRLGEVAGIPVAIVPATMRLDICSKVLELADARAPAPRALIGTATHGELASFLAHTNRFKDADSAIFADPASVKITTVFDYHRAAGEQRQRWGRHRSIYACPLSRQWKLWLESNGKQMTQDAFADFIDANLSDLASAPPGAPVATDIATPSGLLSMARQLVILTVGTFTRKVNETTGESTLICKTEHGEGSTKIPRAFLLQLPVFEEGEKYGVEARVRFSLNAGRPTFSYHLVEEDRVLRDAFAEVRAQVVTQTGLPLFVGSPE